MKRHSSTLAVLAAATLAHHAQAATLYGLGAGNELYRFDSADPSSAILLGTISQPGIVDIDFHAANGLLYGLTSSGSAYNINIANGAATLLFAPGTTLSGIQNFDFNPAVDRMRLVGSGNANYRLVPDFITAPSAPGAAGTVLIDGFYGVPTGVDIVANAYTNAFDTPAGDPAPHATTLYSIGSDGQLYIHSVGPEFNTMTAVGTLGFTIDSPVGFDISATNEAFLSHGSDFYSVDLATGATTSIGSLGVELRGIAIIPEPSTALLGALAGIAFLRRRRGE